MGPHIKMPCGWGCGTMLGARNAAAHFSRCPKRPGRGCADCGGKLDYMLNQVLQSRCYACARAVAQPMPKPDAEPAMREHRHVFGGLSGLCPCGVRDTGAEVDRRILVPIEEEA